MSAKGSFGLAASNNWLLRGTKTNDFIFFTGNSNQSIKFGCSNTSNIQVAIDPSGKLSVGKSNPSYALDVAGDINFDGILRKSGIPYISSQWSNVNNTVFITDSNVVIGASNAITGFTTAYDATFQSNVTIFGQLTVSNVQYVTSNVVILNSQIVNSNITTLNTLTFSNQTGTVFLDSLNNNLGIETSSPQYKLDVVGDINTSGVFRQNGNQIISSQWSSNNSNLYITDSNIGIGTSTPQAQLHVTSNAIIDGTLSVLSGLQCGSLDFVSSSQPGNTLSSSTPVHLFLYGTPTAYTGTDNTTLVGTALNQSVPTRILFSTNTNLNWTPTYSANCRLNIPYNGVYSISYSAGAPIGWQATFAISKNTDTISNDQNMLSYGTIPYITVGYASASIATTALLTTSDYLCFHFMNASSTQLNMTANNTVSITLLYRT